MSDHSCRQGPFCLYRQPVCGASLSRPWRSCHDPFVPPAISRTLLSFRFVPSFLHYSPSFSLLCACLCAFLMLCKSFSLVSFLLNLPFFAIPFLTPTISLFSPWIYSFHFILYCILSLSPFLLPSPFVSSFLSTITRHLRTKIIDTDSKRIWKAWRVRAKVYSCTQAALYKSAVVYKCVLILYPSLFSVLETGFICAIFTAYHSNRYMTR